LKPKDSVSRNARLRDLDELLWSALPHFAGTRHGIAGEADFQGSDGESSDFMLREASGAAINCDRSRSNSSTFPGGRLKYAASGASQVKASAGLKNNVLASGRAQIGAKPSAKKG